jgi:hypothetical protein
MPGTIASTSFGSLDDNHKRRVYQFFERLTLSNPKDLEAQLKNPSLHALSPNETAPLVLLTKNTEAILKTNPALFKYLNTAQQISLENDLRLAFYTLCMRYIINSAEHRRQHLNADFASIEHCAFLINQLNLVINNQALEIKRKDAESNDLSLAHWFRLKIKNTQAFFRDFSAGKTVYLRQWMGDFNTWRLYWVWAGSMLRMVLQAIPEQFCNVQQTTQVATAPQPTLGYISWILYYTRFLINFLLMLKHVIHGPWMSDQEKQLIKEKGGHWNRIKEQLAEKKFALLNDLLWGTTNLLCFFYLIGPALGPIGDLMTTGLLCCDVLLSNWALSEAQEAHQKDIDHYNNEIQVLSDRIGNAKAALNPDVAQQTAEEIQYIEITELQLLRLQQAKQQYLLDWKFKSRKNTTDLLYSAGLLGAFTIMVFPWSHFFAQTAATGLAISGAGLCFALSLVYFGYKADVDIQKTNATRMTVLKQCQKILEVDGKLSEVDFIRYKDLTAEADHHAKMATYQRNTLYRSLFIQSIIPFAIFAAFTFSTFGAGIAISIAGLILAAITYHLVERSKPKLAASYQFEQSEYDNFDKQKEIQVMAKNVGETASHGFFKFLTSGNDNDKNITSNAPKQQSSQQKGKGY